MSLYTYTGPLSAVTLPDGKEVVLFPGSQVDLPDNLPYLDDLNGLGRLASTPAPGADLAVLVDPSEPALKTKKGGA